MSGLGALIVGFLIGTYFRKESLSDKYVGKPMPMTFPIMRGGVIYVAVRNNQQG